MLQFPPRTKGEQFCATHRLDSGLVADSCQGDSGGPLQCEMPIAEEDRDTTIGQARDSRFTIWGITSYGGNSQDACSDSTGKNDNGKHIFKTSDIFKKMTH